MNRKFFKKAVLAAGLGVVSLGLADRVHASASITSADDSVALGVGNFGELNINQTALSVVNTSNVLGVARDFGGGAYRDATAPGCYCEGWGVSGSGVGGASDRSVDGIGVGLVLDSFDSDGSTSTAGTYATSSTHLSGLPDLQVVQSYGRVAETNAQNALLQDVVTITNTGAGTITDVRYVRAMDWDVPTSEFNEFVTIQGTATTAELEMSHDDGFASANPLSFDNSGLGVAALTDVVDNGPADHGAYFRFNFGDLGPGESHEFTIFYGAADNEADALTALGEVGAELYSLGQRNVGGSPGNDVDTFIFGFRGVGGVVLIPDPTPDPTPTPTPTDPSLSPVPEPVSAALSVLGLGALGAVTRRRRA